MTEKWYSGQDQFVWWTGVIESRMDPLALGRVQVRIHGLHNSSLVDIPTDHLPWAHASFAFNESKNVSVPQEAEIVWGFFADGPNKQNPIVVGVLPGFATMPPNTGSGFNDLRSQEQIRLAPKKLVGRN